MSGFDFNIEDELAGIRGSSATSSTGSKQLQTATKTQPETAKQVAPPSGNTAPKPAVSELNVLETSDGLKVKQSQQESLGGGSTVSDTEPTDLINWKEFKTIPGVFEHVGGDRPVRLHPHIRKSQLTGIPEPMLGAVQEHLKEQFIGNEVEFPWGTYQIDEKNRVFTTKSSLIRYLLFDALRDADGTHVQYAKQWLVLQHPVFDIGFNPEIHLGPTNDELDIYALIYVGYKRDLESGGFVSNQLNVSATLDANSESDYQMAERVGMLNTSMNRMLDKLHAQEQAFAAFAERSHTMQTVLLLDRMGLLKGGLPKDIGEFVRLLEQNRDTLAGTGAVVDEYVKAEDARRQTLARQVRMNAR